MTVEANYLQLLAASVSKQLSSTTARVLTSSNLEAEDLEYV